MCGRVIQSSRPFNLAIVHGMNVHESRVSNYPPRYNAAPSQELLVIRRNRDTREVSLDPLRWGLIPYWCKDPKGGRKPINAKAETVASLPMFREAYARRRCILPVDGFFEWKAIKGLKAKQPFAIAMRDGSPFGIAGIWENWKDPATGEWQRTFAIITVPPNEVSGADPQSNAGNLGEDRLRPLVWRRRRPSRPFAAVSIRIDAHVADFNARQ